MTTRERAATPAGLTEIAAWPATSSARCRHYTDEIHEGPRGYHYGASLCSTENIRISGMEQVTFDAECARWGVAPVVIANLPLCKRCECEAKKRGES